MRAVLTLKTGGNGDEVLDARDVQADRRDDGGSIMLMRPDGTVAGRHANAGLKTPIRSPLTANDEPGLDFAPSELPDISVIDIVGTAKSGREGGRRLCDQNDREQALASPAPGRRGRTRRGCRRRARGAIEGSRRRDRYRSTRCASQASAPEARGHSPRGRCRRGETR